VINKAMSKRPQDRYRSAAEFRDALDRPLTAAFDVALKAGKSRKPLIVAAAVAAVAAIAAVIYVSIR